MILYIVIIMSIKAIMSNPNHYLPEIRGNANSVQFRAGILGYATYENDILSYR